MKSDTPKTTKNQKSGGIERPVIYQLLPRLFTNYCPDPVPNGAIYRNGSGKLNDITGKVLGYISALGATHVWYTGVIEHAHDADYTRFGIARNNPHVIKGKAGSPYAITDYYDIDPDLAVDVPRRMAEFEDLVERTHKAGLKVIMDFVPNHVARQYASDSAPAGVRDLGADDDTDMFFSPANNFYYIPRQKFSPHISLGSGADEYIEFPAKATGNDCFTAFPGPNDWYETVKLNYGIDPSNGSRHFDPVPDTWRKMLDILMFWASKDIDGLRCDMVHMVPVEFWHWAIGQVKAEYPDLIFIAEIYDVGLYRPYIDYGGFDYLYDKVTLYDTLRDIECGDRSAAQLTSCWQTVEGIGAHMLNFLENHDEQRYASVQYAGRADTVLPALTVSATMGKGAMMVYMGQEIGEPGADAEGFSGHDGRTTIFDYWSLDTLRRALDGGSCSGRNLTDAEKSLREKYSAILHLVNGDGAVNHGLFFDLMYVNYDNPCFNPHRQYAYMRATADETLIIAVNFGGSDAPETRVVIPAHAFQILGTPRRRYRATDLISGRTSMLTLADNAAIPVPLAAHGAVIWRLSHK